MSLPIDTKRLRELVEKHQALEKEGHYAADWAAALYDLQDASVLNLPALLDRLDALEALRSQVHAKLLEIFPSGKECSHGVAREIFGMLEEK